VGNIENKWKTSMSRRKALAGLGTMIAGSPLLHAQLDPRVLTSHKRIPGLDEMLTAFDFEPVMFANIPLATYDYTAHGDGGEHTLRRNRQAFDWVDLVPGKAVDPKTVDLSTTVLDFKMKYPIIIAPSATQVALHPEGEAGMYRAGVSCANTPMILSNNATQSVEQVAAGAKGQLWWQFYPRQDLDASREAIERAQAAGYTAIVVTVDQQASYYERTQQDRNLGGNPRTAAGRGAPARGGAVNPTDPEAVGSAVTGRGSAGLGPAGAPNGAGARGAGAAPGARGAGAARGGAGGGRGAAAVSGPALYRVNAGRLWYTWQYLDDIRKFIKGPMLVKGIMTAEDAKLCVDRGVNGIIVSNHGGRSMDYGPATLEALPEIVAAVNGRIPIIVDSGFRRGSDVLKALAVGANAVMFGRATRWALGAYGPAGVQKLFDDIIFPELVNAAAAAGTSTMSAINKNMIRTTWP
jgi:isopentenyl diphosphate isomerase/L-lactate dehydrogenase-like FMN-dependent dehydrogenase